MNNSTFLFLKGIYANSKKERWVRPFAEWVMITNSETFKEISSSKAENFYKYKEIVIKKLEPLYSTFWKEFSVK